MYDEQQLVLAQGHAIAALGSFRDSGAAIDYGEYVMYLEEFADLIESLYDGVAATSGDSAASNLGGRR